MNRHVPHEQARPQGYYVLPHRGVGEIGAVTISSSWLLRIYGQNVPQDASSKTPSSDLCGRNRRGGKEYLLPPRVVVKYSKSHEYY